MIFFLLQLTWTPVRFSEEQNMYWNYDQGKMFGRESNLGDLDIPPKYPCMAIRPNKKNKEIYR